MHGSAIGRQSGNDRHSVETYRNIPPADGAKRLSMEVLDAIWSFTRANEIELWGVEYMPSQSFSCSFCTLCNLIWRAFDSLLIWSGGDATSVEPYENGYHRCTRLTGAP